jgi:DNA-binding response OmpR family regulator
MQLNGARAQHPKLLIVEDEYLLADNVARYFAKQGAQVIGFAPSVRKAREIINRGEAFDLAVLDIRLQDAEVYEVADLVRDKGARLVFYTAMEASSLPDRFRNTPVVQKPAPLNQLYQIVMATLA